MLVSAWSRLAERTVYVENVDSPLGESGRTQQASRVLMSLNKMHGRRHGAVEREERDKGPEITTPLSVSWKKSNMNLM